MGDDFLNRRLFYEDQYLSEAECKIVDTAKIEDKILVVLDNSLFYPTGGGQPCDLGWINGQPVIDVFEKDGIIYIQLPKMLDSNKVICKVDFNRRFDLMQQHTGEHLLSAAFLKLYGGINKGFHIGDDYVTIDIDLNEITDEMLLNVEYETNRNIYSNKKIKSYFLHRDEAALLPLRSKIKVKDETIRIVEIENTDMCACCGLHLKTTGETGMVKINKTEKYKGMTRIYFRCGLRALKDYDSKQQIISELMKISSTEECKLPEKTISYIEKISNLTNELKDCKKQNARSEASSLLNENQNKYIFKKYYDRNFEEVQMLSEFLTCENKIFLGTSFKDKKIILCHNGFSEINCGDIFTDNIKKFGGKGGGNAKRAQGTFMSEGDLEKFTEFIISKISGNTAI